MGGKCEIREMLKMEKIMRSGTEDKKKHLRGECTKGGKHKRRDAGKREEYASQE